MVAATVVQVKTVARAVSRVVQVAEVAMEGTVFVGHSRHSLCHKRSGYALHLVLHRRRHR